MEIKAKQIQSRLLKKFTKKTEKSPSHRLFEYPNRWLCLILQEPIFKLPTTKEVNKSQNRAMADAQPGGYLNPLAQPNKVGKTIQTGSSVKHKKSIVLHRMETP